MGKSSFLYAKYLSKSNIALWLILAMMAGFLGSRSIASVAMFLFGINALRDVPPRRWLSQRWYLLGLVWVGLFAASWLWSANKEEWGAHFQTKLPYLFLPLAFGFTGPWTQRDLRIYTVIVLSTMLAGAAYSSSFFFRDPQGLINSYKFSHTLPTPAYRDHISFSMGVAMTIAWCCYSWPLWRSRSSKILIAGGAFLLCAYLHLLAAKTGLLALYLFLACYFIYYLLAKSWKKCLLIGLAIAGVAAGFYRFVPTFRERLNYMSYSWELIRKGERSGLYSDAGRVMSYDIAARLIAAHPVAGVGCGDMLDEMGKGYGKWYPQVTREQWLIPHNQFLTVALAVGIPGALVFVWWTCAPLVRVRRNRDGFFFLTVWLMLLVPLFTDPFLEVQFGVFVYLFFLLMQRSLLRASPISKESSTSYP